MVARIELGSAIGLIMGIKNLENHFGGISWLIPAYIISQDRCKAQMNVDGESTSKLHAISSSNEPF